MLAQPRGFCAGVEKAIKALAWMVRVFDPPVYCYHEIVHNRHVVERFRAQGVIFVDDVADVPEGAPLMLSAHGSAPAVVDSARARDGVVVDAVCPLVTKVHHEMKVRSRKGYTVLYVGHAGHEEAVGTMAVAPESVRLLEHEEDLDALGDLDPAQTPVAGDDVGEVGATPTGHGGDVVVRVADHVDESNRHSRHPPESVEQVRTFGQSVRGGCRSLVADHSQAIAPALMLPGDFVVVPAPLAADCGELLISV